MDNIGKDYTYLPYTVYTYLSKDFWYIKLDVFFRTAEHNFSFLTYSSFYIPLPYCKSINCRSNSFIFLSIVWRSLLCVCGFSLKEFWVLFETISLLQSTYCNIYQSFWTNQKETDKFWYGGQAFKIYYRFPESSWISNSLITILKKWKSVLDKGEYVCFLFMDLSKAFDTTNHDLFLIHGKIKSIRIFR